MCSPSPFPTPVTRTQHHGSEQVSPRDKPPGAPCSSIRRGAKKPPDKRPPNPFIPSPGSKKTSGRFGRQESRRHAGLGARMTPPTNERAQAALWLNAAAWFGVNQMDLSRILAWRRCGASGRLIRPLHFPHQEASSLEVSPVVPLDPWADKTSMDLQCLVPPSTVGDHLCFFFFFRQKVGCTASYAGVVPVFMFLLDGGWFFSLHSSLFAQQKYYCLATSYIRNRELNQQQ